MRALQLDLALLPMIIHKIPHKNQAKIYCGNVYAQFENISNKVERPI